ncbi:hypothetical protein [Goodfellowiella coeruleoviolacea]|uniref:Uncharacterized protein n=1 Tax=Goodfellowiella coeruleoviolacea TaxID=334858 RepID=A0AAE3GK17_9PSEU|nr:hypothetical protein [Goodfellowiella coeruleoviolacea]MCP2168885.1 hypothetical protein [Goodfellowiella coeruleoviolacea]
MTQTNGSETRRPADDGGADKKGFWSGLTGVLTALATLITAIAGLLALFISDQGSASIPGSPTAAGEPGTTAVAASGSTEPESTPSRGPSTTATRTSTAAPTTTTTSGRNGAVRWSGGYTLGLVGMDADAVPPSPPERDQDMDFFYANAFNDTVHRYQAAALGRLSGTAEPTIDDCATAVATHSVDSVELKKDSVFCFASKENRLGFARVVGFDETNFNPTVELAVTIWETTG